MLYPKTPVPTSIRRTLRTIEDSLSFPLTLDDLVHTSGMSKAYFVRMFKRYVGMSPMRYLRRERLTSAAYILRTSTRTIREVAEMFLFADEFTFSKAFKRAFGLPPARYWERGH